MSYRDRAKRAAGNGSATEKKAWGEKYPHRITIKGKKAFPPGVSFTFFVLDMTKSSREDMTGIVEVSCLNAKRTIIPKGQRPFTITDQIPIPHTPEYDVKEFLEKPVFEWEGQPIFIGDLMSQKKTKEEYGEEFYPFRSAQVRLLVAVTSVHVNKNVNVKAEECPLIQLKDRIEVTGLPQVAYLQLNYGQFASMTAESLKETFDGDSDLSRKFSAINDLDDTEKLQAMGNAFIDLSEPGDKKKRYAEIAPPFEFLMKAVAAPGNGFGDKKVILEPCWDQIDEQVQAAASLNPADRQWEELVGSKLLKAVENHELLEAVNAAMWSDELTLEEFKKQVSGLTGAGASTTNRASTRARSFGDDEDDDEDEGTATRSRNVKARKTVDEPDLSDDLDDEEEEEVEAPKPKAKPPQTKKAKPVVEEPEDEDYEDDEEDEDDDEVEEQPARQTTSWASRKRNRGS
jgi:hypothetical protein